MPSQLGPVLLVDAGLALFAIGAVSALRPLRFLRIASRGRAVALLVAGLGLVALGMLWPAGPLQLAGPPMLIDAIIPEYEFGESHELQIHAPAERVERAVREVTASEIRLFRLLTWIRSPRLPGSGRADLLAPPAEAPILEVALRSGFTKLQEEAGRELVFGTVVCCGRRAEPRDRSEFLALQGTSAKAVMNFRIEPEGGGTVRLVTQTRIHATNAEARRRFARYWRVIYPGSALLRRTWLRAIRERAERPL